MAEGLNQAISAGSRNVGHALQPGFEQQSGLHHPLHVLAVDLNHRFADFVAVAGSSK